MSILAALPFIGKVLDKGFDVIDSMVEDKDKANELKAAIKRQIEDNTHEKDLEIIKAQAGILTAEVKGESWLQRNWRPLLMLTVIIIIFNNYVFYPYFSLFTDKVTVLELPGGLWALLNIGVGGYIGARTYEKKSGLRK